MAKKSLKLALAGGALALGLSSGAFAAEIASGKMLVDTCSGCHGTNGNSVGPASPSIAGMDPLVFVDMMLAFQSGDTYSTIMGRIARGYSEDEIERMGEYLKEQPFVPVKQAYDESLVADGEAYHEKFCSNCHEEGGKALADVEDYIILAGQWTPYLQFAMEDFMEERRMLPKKMGRKLEQMLEEQGDKSLDALYAYYASQQDYEQE
ncbi:cytochrome c4 [Lamprobacter modestohalophilus]|uniref:c-type cytochrome n=1 Tax=Lamprobacter modestohalophilus TaxID=1064514 RepID=UPI002ADEB214|nr:c-type cytochrome [Lamprobacter modestohalophilus]MEA1051548.1 cytochrome c4 [Lamprobacter modestohalophilus]